MSLALFHAVVDRQGKLQWHDMRGLERFLGGHVGRHFRVSFAEPKRSRSGKQNNFYWGTFLPALAAAIGEFATKEALERIHDALKIRYLPMDVRGGLELPGSTAALSTKEFEEFLENIRIDAASGEFGHPITLPVPNEE